MLPFDTSVIELIKQRHSCRTYEKRAIAAETAARLAAFCASVTSGPFGTPLRFELAAAAVDDPGALKGLGTYGFIKEPAGFIIGAVAPGKKNLEDFGWGMEAILLYATGLGLGSCWLGGSFAKSRFASRIHAGAAEIVPAVAAVGYRTEETPLRRMMRSQIKSDSRKPWEALFFRDDFGTSMRAAEAGAYQVPLAMLRLAPSASNGQPWRVVQKGECYHFYLQRKPGFTPGRASLIPFTIADLPRIDLGIAMCHFQWTAEELGMKGRWELHEEGIPGADETREYIASWNGSNIMAR